MGKEAGPGDIVTLPSGSPDLTVLCVYDAQPEARSMQCDGCRDRIAHTCWAKASSSLAAVRVASLGWFTAAGEYRTGTVPLAALQMRSSVEREPGNPLWARDVPSSRGVR